MTTRDNLCSLVNKITFSAGRNRGVDGRAPNQKEQKTRNLKSTGDDDPMEDRQFGERNKSVKFETDGGDSEDLKPAYEDLK